MEEEYPIIWKKESCFTGECKDSRISHWWSLPFTVPQGLVSECYNCHKTKQIRVEK